MKTLPMMLKTSDGSWLDESSRFLFLSIDRFVKDIAQGDCCFICATAPGNAAFNKEHVLPNWILNRFKLHEKSMTLPGGGENIYGGYTIPCCKNCNTLLGRKYEAKISRAVSGGYETFIRFLQSGGGGTLFLWLTAIFLKTHLKDKSNPLPAKFSKHEFPNAKIADLVNWEELHHAHCVARAVYSGASLTPPVVGSLFVFRMREDEDVDQFDYSDVVEPQTMMIRMGDIGVVAVINDAKAVQHKFGSVLRKMGRVTRIQLREIFARAAALNLQIKKRPKFSSRYDRESGELTIAGKVPEILVLKRPSSKTLGGFMDFACGANFKSLPIEHAKEGEKSLRDLRAGRYTFFHIDDEGYFLPFEAKQEA